MNVSQRSQKRNEWIDSDDFLLLSAVTFYKGKYWRKVSLQTNKTLSQCYLRFSRMIVEELYGCDFQVCKNFNNLKKMYEKVELPRKMELYILLAMRKFDNDMKKVAEWCDITVFHVQEVIEDIGIKRCLFEFFIDKIFLTLEGYEASFTAKDEKEKKFSIKNTILLTEYKKNLQKIKKTEEGLVLNSKRLIKGSY